jgi:2'-5' RNA ligase
MNKRYAFFDGQKSYPILDDTPGLWNYFSNAPRQEVDILYAKVSAVFRAFNLKANTVGNMPFTLTHLKTGEEFDNSASWENKVKFMHQPSELFRLDTLSYMMTNTVYNLITKDILGRKDKRLLNAIPGAFTPQTDPVTGNLTWVERRIGSGIEKYNPEGTLIGGDATSPRLIRMWRLDHTTEVLPSPNTEALAVTNAAGIIYHADTWIQHFFARGGVVPMIIGMKGAVTKERKEEVGKSFTKWYLGLADRFRNIFYPINADTLDVQKVGSGIEELKDNVVYEQALKNIAAGTGMPLSLLMANSANYATAKEEKATWYENDIIPLCNWMAYGYNEQVFHPLNLHLEFRPETLDPNQEDETERATALSTYGDALAKYPTYELLIGMAETLGLELSDGFKLAAEEYYKQDKGSVTEEGKPAQTNGVIVAGGAEGIQQQALNGAQVSSLVEVLNLVASGQLPRSSAVELIVAAFPVTREMAESILGEIGQGFEPEKPAPKENPIPPKRDTQAESGFEDEETEEEEEKTVKSAEVSAMIALRIPDPIREEIAAKYPFVDAETLDNLHITLIYLGDSRTLNKIDMIRAASDFAACQSPIKGTLQGLARFVNGTETDPLVCTFDSPQMPQVYTALASCLEVYRIPYRREHGFIPHMTLAYIPADSEMPIDTIEPIEINFSEIYLVDGGEWFAIPLTGYDNKTAWRPSLDELEELRVWREVALRKQKKGESLDFEYEPHHGGVHADLAAKVKAKLAAAQSPEDVKMAFVIEETVTPAPVYSTHTIEPDPSILALAESINRLAEVYREPQEVKAVEPVAPMIPNVNITMPNISLTAQMPEQGTVIVNVPEQPAPVVNVEVQPTPIEITNEVQAPSVEIKNEMPQPKVVVMDNGPKDIKIERNRDGKITGAKVE